MKPDYTHMAVILDRTGSMESIRDDTIGGFNVFLKEQTGSLISARHGIQPALTPESESASFMISGALRFGI